MIAVIGDGALTGGLAFEGLNNAGELRQAADRDPERQRDEHLAQHRRDRTATSPSSPPAASTARFERDVWELLGKLPRAGARAEARAAASRRACRTWSCRACCSRSWASSTSARSTATTSTCSRRRSADLKRFEEPVLLHVVTTQGQGLRARPSATRPRSTASACSTPRPAPPSKGAKKTYTHVFGETAIEIGERMPERGRGDRRDDRQHRAQGRSRSSSRSASSTSAWPRSTRSRSRPGSPPTA